MPIYEYACAACGHEFEEWQKMSDAPVRTCPKCKKKKVERLISRTAFQLKGSGWYADLYSSSKPGADGKASESKSDAAAGSSDSSDSSAASSDASGKASKDSAKPSGKTEKSTGKSTAKKESSSKKAEPRAA